MAPEPDRPPEMSAYDDLIAGLRALAAQIERAADADAAAVGLPPPHPVHDEPLAAAARGVSAVLLQAALLGTALTAGFNVWMTLFPPLRPTI